MSTAIERFETKIKEGKFLPKPLKFRVYTLTRSPVHLAHGADFNLYMSFGTKELADAEAKEINEKGFEFAVVIEGKE